MTDRTNPRVSVDTTKQIDPNSKEDSALDVECISSGVELQGQPKLSPFTRI
jgi:hypothetical protein